ncbi:MAG: hypothetical protein EA388_12790 [Nitriliruptor sp.]|nr:MAG: hypothetical protein EA388_12790 [Nitriliruptor sp.]
MRDPRTSPGGWPSHDGDVLPRHQKADPRDRNDPGGRLFIRRDDTTSCLLGSMLDRPTRAGDTAKNETSFRDRDPRTNVAETGAS